MKVVSENARRGDTGPGTCFSAKASLQWSDVESTIRMIHCGGRVKTGCKEEEASQKITTAAFRKGKEWATDLDWGWREAEKKKLEREAGAWIGGGRATRTRWASEISWEIMAVSAYCTFSFSPEDEGPEVGDDLKLVVALSSHLSDSTGQDHPLGVHLLNRGGDKSADHKSRR